MAVTEGLRHGSEDRSQNGIRYQNGSKSSVHPKNNRGEVLLVFTFKYIL